MENLIFFFSFFLKLKKKKKKKNAQINWGMETINFLTTTTTTTTMERHLNKKINSMTKL